jgi:hypothetical protein
VFEDLDLLPFAYCLSDRWAVYPKLQGCNVLFGKAKVIKMEDTFNICLVFCFCHIKVKLFVIVINTTSFVWNFMCLSCENSFKLQ